MSDTVIEVKNLSKKYRIGQLHKPGVESLRESLMGIPRSIMGVFGLSDGENNSSAKNEIWALCDVSFNVSKGEKIGVIGRNGAGKSTLLKILSQITEPTEGEFTIKGQTASLLEVGTGFHPELTGRENVFLNGAVLGMSRTEINKRFDEIVAFAEVEEFLDTPVKRYSSGMYVRLAFAVAAHLEPEILLVDEVLAVGDAAFQRKCLGKMNAASKAGRTIFLVSHNMLTVGSLCDRVIWLHDGRIMETGDAGKVISKYLSSSFSAVTKQCWRDSEDAPGNDEVRLNDVRIMPVGGSPDQPISINDPFLIEFSFDNLKQDAYLNAGLQLYNEYGVMVFDSAPVKETEWLDRPFPEGEFKYTCHVPGDFLNNGLHRISLTIVKDSNTVIHHEVDALQFEIVDSIENRAGWYGKWDGAVRPILDWKIERI